MLELLKSSIQTNAKAMDNFSKALEKYDPDKDNPLKFLANYAGISGYNWNDPTALLEIASDAPLIKFLNDASFRLGKGIGLTFKKGFGSHVKSLAEALVNTAHGFNHYKDFDKWSPGKQGATEAVVNLVKRLFPGAYRSHSTSSYQGEWAGNQRLIHASLNNFGHWQGTTTSAKGYSHSSGKF